MLGFVRLGALAAAALAGLGGPAAAALTNPHNLGDCRGCHRETPRFGIDTLRTVGFTTSADDPGLCTPCHTREQYLHPVGVDAGSGPAGAKRSAFLPAGSSLANAGKVVCTSCHFIHAADGRFGLLRGFPGTPDPRIFRSWEEVCRECHGANLETRSPHVAGERACAFCHPARPAAGAEIEVAKLDRSLCRLCHPRAGETHGADLKPEAGELECLRCHDPHAASAARPGLLREAFLAAAIEGPTVRPHHRRGLCLACHENLDDYELRGGGVTAACERCHASGRIAANIHPLRPVPPRITPPKGWPLEGGALTCLTCHEQGHEDQERRPHLLRDGPYAQTRDVCARCHSGADLLSSTLHADVGAGNRCEFCHRTTPVVGRDRSGDVTFIADPDLLCLRCHDVKGDSGRHHRRYESQSEGPLKLPDFLPLYGGRIICATCHNPHLLEPDLHRLRGGIEESALCQGCHAE